LDALRFARTASRTAVLLSIALLPAALAAPLLGLYPVHAYIMAACLLPLFVAGVAVSYTASALAPRRAYSTVAFTAAVTFVTALLLTGSALYSLAISATPAAPVVAAYVLVALGHWASAAKLGGAARLSVGGLALSYTLAAGYTVAAHIADVPYYELMLGLVYAIPVTAIYSVTIYSLPKTYHSEPRSPLVALLYAVQASGLALYIYQRHAGLALLSLALALYPAAARFNLLHEGLRAAREKAGAVRLSHLYYVWGHIAALGFTVASIASSIAYMLGPSWPRLMLLVHSLALGFTACHIELHAPLMLPVILGVPSARRYNPAPYILLALSLILHPLNGTASLAVFTLSLLATALIVLPRRL
jgi:hypothetical protein